MVLFKLVKTWLGALAQWMKCFWCKHKGLSLDSQQWGLKQAEPGNCFLVGTARSRAGKTEVESDRGREPTLNSSLHILHTEETPPP